MFDKIIMNITQNVRETQEKFIFQTLCDFAKSNYQIEVKKEDLAKAIEILKLCKRTDTDITEVLETATKQYADINKAYNRGFHDGVDNERKRVMDILKAQEDLHVKKED